MQRFANPNRFLKAANAVLPWSAWITAGCLVTGLYFAIFASPADYQQGETVRIMYVHVPSAWMASFIYANMAIASAVALIWKHPLAHLAAKSSAPIGAAFTIICLASGMLWGKPTWGTWWVWDARLTSVLILLFIYVGYIALVNAFDDTSRGLRAGAVLAIVGAVNLPIIKFSVDWWNTLHQPASLIRLDAPAIHSSMLMPLLLMGIAFLGFYVTLLILKMNDELAGAKIRGLRLAQAR